jgi:hypothetical protein
MTSTRCVFIDKMLIIKPNTTLRSSRIVFYYTILRFRLSRSVIVREMLNTQKIHFLCVIYPNRSVGCVCWIINILWTVSREYYLCVCSNGRNLILWRRLIRKIIKDFCDIIYLQLGNIFLCIWRFASEIYSLYMPLNILWHFLSHIR